MRPSAKLTLTRRAALLSAAAMPIFGLPGFASPPARETRPGARPTASRPSATWACRRDFSHFPYARPDAPKGGQLIEEAVATSYDSLNGFILSGNPATGLSLINDSLMAGSLDEDNTVYGLVAAPSKFPRTSGSIASICGARRGFMTARADGCGRGVLHEHPARQRPPDHPAIAARPRKGDGRGR